MGKEHDDSPLMFALGNPLRRRILRTMSAVERISPRELADELGEPLGNVSYHVLVLLGKGAVRLVGNRRRRGAMQHFYSFAIEEPWALAALGLDPGNGGGDH